MQTFLEKQEAGKDFHASPITHAPDTYLPRPSPGCPGSERCLQQPQKLKRHPQCWARRASTLLSSMRGRSLPSAPSGTAAGRRGVESQEVSHCLLPKTRAGHRLSTQHRQTRPGRRPQCLSLGAAGSAQGRPVPKGFH